MKRIFTILTLVMSLVLTSCTVSTFASDTTPQVYEDIYYTYQVDYQTIVTKGTPVYIDGEFAYYTYRNIFYYPYFWNNNWYFHPYRTVQPRGFVHRPHPDFRPDNRFKRPDHFVGNMDRGPHMGHKPNIMPNNNRHTYNPQRPNVNMRGGNSPVRQPMNRGTQPQMRSGGNNHSSSRAGGMRHGGGRR